MIREYCLERIKKIQELISYNEVKLEKTLGSINSAQLQIDKIVSQVDEATNIFSVVAREDNGTKSKEIAELEEKIQIYNEELRDIENILSENKNELDKIKLCIEELDNIEQIKGNTYINTMDEDEEEIFEEIDISENSEIQEAGYITTDIIDKLKFCKTLINVDPNRAMLEINNIIGNIIKK